MQHARIAAVFACLTLLVGACAPSKQYRTQTVDRGGATKICEVRINSDDVGTCTIQHRYYSYPVLDKTEAGTTAEMRSKTANTKDSDYYLSFVEFDDQGWFWDRKQMEALLRMLYEQQKKDGGVQDFLIFVHAHGWQHNAGACDNNVVCFQRLLERFDIMERRIEDLKKQKNSAYEPNPRTIVGVYIGWRGRSITVPVVDNLSFWERKNTAQRVGTGGVTELLTRLNDFRRYMNPRRSEDKTQMIISGHSFGGEVIYSAISHSLVERAARTVSSGGRYKGRAYPIHYETANSFGDLIVLVNPAFEGTKYEPLYHVATNRCYTPEQRPVMLIVTSDADQATKKAFPLGRSVSTFFETTQSRKSQIEQKDTILDTVGHLDRYRTHRLALTDEKYWKDRTETKNEKCGCPYLGPTAEFVLKNEEIEFYKGLARIPKKAKNGQEPYAVSPPPLGSGERLGEVQYGKDLKLVPNDKIQYAANFPYLVIKTGEKLIRDHNAIYGENFTDFLRRFYVRHIRLRVNFPAQCFPEGPDADGKERIVPACKPTAITPCKQSCQRADGSSCSGRSAESGSPAG